MEKAKKFSLNFIKMIILPLIVYLIFFIICRIQGADKFGVGTDLMVIFRTTIYTGFIALAVSYNLTSGRFDFSIGAVLILSTILGVNISLQLGLGPVPMLMLCLISGAVLGSISGFVYIILRLPPMIVSLGVAMVYEAIGFIITKGKGASLIGRDEMLIWSKQPYIYILCIVILIILFVLLNKTQFGFNTNSLRSGQQIAVNTGINEKTNTIICYAIAGVLLAGAGVISISILGTMPPNLGLTSIAYIQNAFLPMFIGNVLAKYGDRNTGVIMGSLTQAIITSAFGSLGISSSWQMILNSIIVICFFAYAYNSYRIVEFEMFKQKKKKALEEE